MILEYGKINGVYRLQLENGRGLALLDGTGMIKDPLIHGIGAMNKRTTGAVEALPAQKCRIIQLAGK